MKNFDFLSLFSRAVLTALLFKWGKNFAWNLMKSHKFWSYLGDLNKWSFLIGSFSMSHDFSVRFEWNGNDVVVSPGEQRGTTKVVISRLILSQNPGKQGWKQQRVGTTEGGNHESCHFQANFKPKSRQARVETTEGGNNRGWKPRKLSFPG